jgi:hypothetical protein
VWFCCRTGAVRCCPAATAWPTGRRGSATARAPRSASVRRASRSTLLDKNPGRAFIDAPGDGGFLTAPDLVRFGRALLDGTLLDRPWADVLTAANTPIGPGTFGAYLCAISIVGSQWMYERGGGNPGVGANWDIYPYTGWVGVILSNIDGAPLVDMIGQEMHAITGVAPGAGSGG